MKDKRDMGIMKKLLRGTVCMAVGLLFGILFIPLGMIYLVICVVWETADHMIKKTEGS